MNTVTLGTKEEVQAILDKVNSHETWIAEVHPYLAEKLANLTLSGDGLMLAVIDTIHGGVKENIFRPMQGYVTIENYAERYALAFAEHDEALTKDVYDYIRQWWQEKAKRTRG